MWAGVERAALEVWALPHTDRRDVERVLNRCADFGSLSWDPDLKEKIEFQEVFDFWTGKSSKEKNLFLSRT
jgi:hypothetical protein